MRVALLTQQTQTHARVSWWCRRWARARRSLKEEGGSYVVAPAVATTSLNLFFDNNMMILLCMPFMRQKMLIDYATYSGAGTQRAAKTIIAHASLDKSWSARPALIDERARQRNIQR